MDPNRRSRHPEFISVMNWPLADDGLVVQPGSDPASQVANVYAAVLHGQRAVVSTDQRASELKVAVRSSSYHELRRIDGHRTAPSLVNHQSDSHCDHPPRLASRPEAVDFENSRVSARGKEVGKRALGATNRRHAATGHR
jgi:hypothetical protein